MGEILWRKNCARFGYEEDSKPASPSDSENFPDSGQGEADGASNKEESSSSEEVSEEGEDIDEDMEDVSLSGDEREGDE